MEEHALIEKPKTPFVKRALKFFLYLVLFTLLFLAALLALLFVYEDEVKSAIVKELNKHLKAEVRINPENIDLTIVKTFPDCSIEFKNVLMLEALPVKKRDTLLFAGQLNLFFNISDLWNRNYEIQRIKLKDALVKPLVLKNGGNNYTFWESDEGPGTSKSDSMRFNLQHLEIQNCVLEYKDKQKLFKTRLEIKKLDFRGSFAQKSFNLEAGGEILIKYVAQQKNSMLRDKTLDFKVELDVNGNSYKFKKTKINLNKLGIELEGGFNYKDSIGQVELAFSAPKLDIGSALSLLPEGFKDKINDYNSDGNFYANGRLNYSSSKDYLLETVFGIKKGEITYRPKSTSATNINLEGTLKYSPSYSSLELKNVYLELNHDAIKGNGGIRNFSDPYIRVSTQAGLNLQNLQDFWPIDTLSKLQGMLMIDLALEGSLSDLKARTFSEKVKLELNANVTNLEAQFSGDEKVYSVENCSITARERQIEVHDLKLKRGNSDIKLNGKMPGVFNYLADRTAPLIIDGNLYSESLNLEDFIPAKSGAGQGDNAPIIPANVEFRLQAAISKFSFSRFEAGNIAGQVDIRNQKAMVREVRLETMEGDALLNAFADNSGGQLDIHLQGDLKNINISSLFSQFNNFGQATLVDKNLKGFASAGVDFSGTWSNRLEVDYSAIRAHCNLNIEKGELIDFKPLLSLSKYLDINDLKHIRFSSLQSSIDIKDKTIFIPKTAIKNSALNIELWGSHTFENDIDYHIRLLINEWRAKKRKNKPDDEEFGPIEKDLENRRSAFIKMSGNIDNPEIKYDMKGMKEKVREDIREEKQTIKQIMKEEFGLFKKDSVRKASKKPEQIFELENTKPPKKTGEPKKKDEDDEDF